jgi:hypothetical protein
MKTVFDNLLPQGMWERALFASIQKRFVTMVCEDFFRGINDEL